MRMLVHVKMPLEPFNSAVRDGSIARKMSRVMEEIKPEAVYFTNYDGRRGAIMIVDVADPTRVPAIAEPWFLMFNAEVEFHVVMGPEELARAGLETLGKKWGTA
jgi:hypothetical protein